MNIFYAFTTLDKYKSSQMNIASLRSIIRTELEKAGHKIDMYGKGAVGGEWHSENFDDNATAVLTKIKEADVFIGEMSVPSQTLGFLIAYALQHGKPSLYIYPDDTNGAPAAPLAANPSRLVTIRAFNEKTALKEIQRFLKKAQKQLRSDRTTFVTTKYINDFLQSQTKKTGLSKGEVIRGILESAIEEDIQYQQNRG